MSSTPSTLESSGPTGPRIGVLGAGQLGRMLALAGYPLGCEFLFVDPVAQSPAGLLAPQLVGAYDSELALERLAACDVVTYEFESVLIEPVERLAQRTPVFPPPLALRVAQDRLHEKQCFRELGIPTAAFAPVSSEADLRAALEALGLPAVLKTRRFGYDGKGQFVLRKASDAGLAWQTLGGASCILEAFVPFARELSVLGVRGREGQTAFYPLVENEHRDGILRLTWAPATQLDAALTAQAESYSARLLDHLGYVGVLALELFQVGTELFANEMAPRVHNSGHFSIEGAVTSQFENHVRAITGLPLGVTDVSKPCAMLNLVGAMPRPEAVLAIAGAKLHLYGKAPRPRRKVGHITLVAPDEEALKARVHAASSLPGVL